MKKELSTMKFTATREALLQPLQTIIGVVDRRQTLPILGNALITVNQEQLSVLGTDLEVELIGRLALTQPSDAGQITVPARKLYDICRSTPENTLMQCTVENQRFIVKAGRSRFALQTLPALDFPNIEESPSEHRFKIPQKELRYLLEQTHFAIAQQDVRYYLNGLLFEIKEQQIRCVATDGHRMSLCSMMLPKPLGFHQVIVPRKGVAELLRLLQTSEDEVEVILAQHHLRVIAKDFTFTSKLIDGKYPDYNKVLPKASDKKVILDRDELKQALARVTILSNEKFRGVSLQWQENALLLQSHNTEHEEAEEKLEVTYLNKAVQMGFNANYLLDVLNCMAAGDIELAIAEAETSLLIQPIMSAQASSLFVIMPVLL
jgi:DNA polymerase-3 subunit beta